MLLAVAGEHATLMAREMGKPVSQGRSEAEKCATACDFYAEHAESMLADVPVDSDASKSFVACRPLGLVLAVMPWNFPYWQVIRFAAPTLAAGNGALLKHASNVTGCSLALDDLFERAGFPHGLFRSLLATHDQAEALIGSRAVAAVTLTGSTAAGRTIAARAGREVKKVVLELGGSDAFVVLADADLESAARCAAASRLVNGGQSCIAAKRFIVVESVAARFTELFVERMRAVKVGPAIDESTEVGPMARLDLREQLHDQVLRSVAQGAVLLLGGEPAPGPGAFYPPTVLGSVREGTVTFEEEVFGPVASVVSARDEADAIRLANASEFGLGAAVFTSDEERGGRIARDELDAGACFVNGLVKSDPRLPFGGVKSSGHGRELGEHGIREFVNLKTVWIA
jgi:succinate-semialdehyde dehydrogenase/glutarate-semialdehyde dehydrogenase